MFLLNTGSATGDLYLGSELGDTVVVSGTFGGLVETARFTTAGDFVMATGFIKRSTAANVTASTTQTQGQSPLTAELNNVATVANLNDVVTLPPAVVGTVIVITNNGNSQLQIFPASGDDVNGNGVDTSVTLGTTQTAALHCVASGFWTGGRWTNI
jgi:hypothetical protein